jgi:hypothetical protein
MTTAIFLSNDSTKDDPSDIFSQALQVEPRLFSAILNCDNPHAGARINPVRPPHGLEKWCQEMNKFNEIHIYLNANLEKIKSRLRKYIEILSNFHKRK